MLLHGFTDTWRIWELVLPGLERHHDVLALTLAGPRGRAALQGEIDTTTLPDAVERAMDEAGFETAHFAGNSLGGFVSLQLAARGRARSVVAFAPAGGWPQGDEHYQELLASQATMCEQAKATAPHATTIVSTPEGRRQVTRLTAVSFEHIPPELLAHQLHGTAGCFGAPALIEYALREGFELDAERDRLPGAHRVGHARRDRAVAGERRALPRRMAAAGRLGRARGRRPLPAARRPARDGAAHPRVHLALTG